MIRWLVLNLLLKDIISNTTKSVLGYTLAIQGRFLTTIMSYFSQYLIKSKIT